MQKLRSPLQKSQSDYRFSLSLKAQSGQEIASHATSSLLVAFSSLARILGDCSTIHSPLVLFFFFLSEGSVHSVSATETTVA